MLTFTTSFDKNSNWVVDPILKKRELVYTPAYTPEQYEMLEAQVVSHLGEAFVSLEISEFPSHQEAKVSYNGPLVDDVEQFMMTEIDAAFNAWYSEIG